MSLNRAELVLYDYIRSHPDERQHFEHKVRAIVAGADEAAKAVARLDSELWRYFEERRTLVPALHGAVPSSGPQRTSMKNLAEFLIRLWIQPKPAKPPADAGAARP
jgi:hypothetical protein